MPLPAPDSYQRRLTISIAAGITAAVFMEGYLLLWGPRAPSHGLPSDLWRAAQVSIPSGLLTCSLTYIIIGWQRRR
jgi:hypothetical protein